MFMNATEFDKTLIKRYLNDLEDINWERKKILVRLAELTKQESETNRCLEKMDAGNGKNLRDKILDIVEKIRESLTDDPTYEELERENYKLQDKLEILENELDYWRE